MPRSAEDTEPLKNIQISDFGLSKSIARESVYGKVPMIIITIVETQDFPIRWSPPEVIQSRTFSQASDVWSFGENYLEFLTVS